MAAAVHGQRRLEALEQPGSRPLAPYPTAAPEAARTTHPFPLAPVLGRDPGVRDRVWERARDLGLGGAAPVVSLGAPTARSLRQGELDDAVLRRVMDAGDPARLSTALGWLQDYLAEYPGPLLTPRGGPGDLTALAANDRAFLRVAEFIRRRGSKQPGHKGEQLPGDTIFGYISALRSAAGVLSGVPAWCESESTLATRMAKQMNLGDPPSEDRKYRRGLRAEHVRSLIAQGYDIISHHGLTRLTGFNVGRMALLRGGEFGVVQRSRSFVPARDLHWGDTCVVWHTAADTGYSAPSLSLLVVSIKDQGKVRAKRIPIPIPALHPSGETNDPACGYSCMCRMWRRDAAHLTEAQRKVTPIFRSPEGRVWATADVESMVKEAATFLGMPAGDFGAVSMRIAGATDMRAAHGMAGADMINAQGRWKDEDIGFIYQRVTALEQLEAVAVAQRLDPAPALEDVIPTYTQGAGRTGTSVSRSRARR